MGPVRPLLSKLAASYWELLNRFLPDDIKADRQAANQARMFLVSHTIGPILGNSVPLAFYIFDPTPGTDIALLSLAISAFWAYPFLLRRGFDYHRLVEASVLNLNFCILWSMYFNGGVASPTVPWLLVIPILSLFYIGGEHQLRSRLLAISGLCFLLFMLLYEFVDPRSNDLPVVAMHGLGAVSTVAALCYVAMMAIYYARIFDAGVELESEVRRRRAAADELRRAVIKIDRAGTAKSEFLARMSHELRTPLNAIIGYGQILKDDAEDEADEMLKKDMEKILDAGLYLLRLINMILDLSKIEAGKMRFDARPHALRGLLEKAVEARRGEIEAGGNAVSLLVDPDIGTVEIDEMRFLQVLDAILENAVHHTKNGRISILATARRAVDGIPQEFAVDVGDTGPGIDPESLATLFQSFSTTREASNGRYGGTGLNLAVTSEFCRAMGGGISARSEIGHGSVFTLHFPVRAAVQAGAAGRAPARPLLAA